ncbi:MAG: ABC transporter substrate-binding protein [Pseudomonadota bacterium]
MRHFTLTGAVAAGAILLSAAAGAQDLRVGIPDDPDMLDPDRTRSFYGVTVLSNLCDSLFELDENMEFSGELATDWSWSDDGLELTVNLRPDVTFQDGTPFNAQAVVYNIERSRDLPGTLRTADLGTITDISADDDMTVVFDLSAPFAPLLAKLSERLGMMISPTAAEELGEDFGNQPVCAGPYQFAERVAQDRIVIERYPGYWNPDPYHVEQVTFSIIPDPTIRLANLQSGEMDIIARLSPTDVAQVEADPDIEIEAIDSLGYQSLIVNVAKGPRAETPLGQDPAVREAFELSLDRQAMVDVAFEGQYTAGNQFASPNSPIYNSDIPIPPRDPERARAILAEAGYTDPVPVEILVPNRPNTVRVAEMIQAMGSDAGFDVSLNVVEFASTLNLSDQGDFEVWGPIGPQTAIDPDDATFMSLHSTGDRNVGLYSNPDMDAAMEESRRVTDPEARRDVLRRVAEIITNDRTVIYLYHTRFIWAFNDNVEGFVAYPDGHLRVRGISVN